MGGDWLLAMSRRRRKENDELAKELENLKLRLEEVERLARGRSFLDMFKFWNAQENAQERQAR